MGLFEELEILVDISRLPSMTQVAHKRGVAKSAISRRLAALEERVGGLLVVRSSHNLSLTELGESYLGFAQNTIDQLADLQAQHRPIDGPLEGKLRLSVPQDFGQAFLVPEMCAFQERHPNLALHVNFDNRIVDMVAEKYDLAIRIGVLPDSQLFARRFQSVKHVLCAAPSYIEQHGAPQTLTDLKSHKILHYGTEQQFKLTVIEGGQRKDILLRGSGSSNNGIYLTHMTKHGAGIARLPQFLVHDALAKGALVRVLPEFDLPEAGLYAIFPSTRYMPAGVRALVDFLYEKCNENFNGT